MARVRVSAKAKAKARAAKPLPHLAAAVFCEQALEDKEGMMTVVRILDVLIVAPPSDWSLPPEGAKEAKPAVPVLAFVSFKSGDAKGEYGFRFDMILPSGKREKMAEGRLNFLGNENGVNVKLAAFAPVAEEGLLWYEVLVDDILFTRMPLRIRHAKPQQQATPETRPSPKNKT
jgi:hypothetical protein